MRGCVPSRDLPWCAPVLCFSMMLLAAAPAGAVDLPEGFTDEVVLRNLIAPTSIAFAPDGRVFVAEKSGIVKVFAQLGAPTATVFADLRTQVHDVGDRGLMSIKLHPSFATEPYLYVAYTLDAAIGGTPPLWGSDGQGSDRCPEVEARGCPVAGRLSRLHVSIAGMVGAEVVLLENWCQQFTSHSLGGLAFDSSGALFVSAGDGAAAFDVDYGQAGTPPNPCDDPPGGAGRELTIPGAQGGAVRSQNIDMAGFERATFDGKILRLDPITGAAVPDNPLFGSPVPGADRIVARGMRQPFRIAVRPGTNELWFAEVGWSTWEEINRIEDPTATVPNFGWPCIEGPDVEGAYAALGLDVCEALYSDPSQHQTPYFAYNHHRPVVPGDPCGSDSAAITGLAFYSGQQYPQRYAGALFFADYVRSCIWAMLADSRGVPDPSTITTFASGAPNPIDLQVGPDGSLFYVDIIGGTVRRITFMAGNRAPTAVITASATSGFAPLEVQFDASASTDPDGDELTFRWDLNGDGAIDANTATTGYTYTENRRFTVTLTATDTDGASSTAVIEIRVGEDPPPTAQIVLPSPNALWTVGDEINFEGEGEDARGDPLSSSAFAWRLMVRHCPVSGCHAHLLHDFQATKSGSFVAPNHEYPFHLELELTVTDTNGQTDTERVLLYPLTAEVVGETEPAGLQLAVGVKTGVTPFSQTVPVQGRLTVTAPSPQGIGCREYTFIAWSDGGTRSHQVRVPTSGVHLVARFEPLSEGPCPRCPGDCNLDGQVHVDEIVTTVNIATGQQVLASCPSADDNNDGVVTVDEVIKAVVAALSGCPGEDQ